MFEKNNIEKCKKDVVTRSARIQELSGELKEAKSFKLALREAQESGSSSKNSGDELSKISVRISETEERIEANLSLLDKAKQKLYQVVADERLSDEGELNSLFKSVTLFRKDRLRELGKVIVEAQVLANLARGEAYGTDILHTVDFLFQPDEADSRAGAKSHTSMIGEIESITRERYQNSPLGKKDLLEERINSRKEMSIILEAEKLLSEEHLVNKTQESGV